MTSITVVAFVFWPSPVVDGSLLFHRKSLLMSAVSSIYQARKDVAASRGTPLDSVSILLYLRAPS